MGEQLHYQAQTRRQRWDLHSIIGCFLMIPSIAVNTEAITIGIFDQGINGSVALLADGLALAGCVLTLWGWRRRARLAKWCALVLFVVFAGAWVARHIPPLTHMLR